MTLLQNSFDRLVLGFAVLLILLITALISFSGQETVLGEILGESQVTLPTQVLYSALDAEFREQLFVADLDVDTKTVGDPTQVTSEEIGVWDFALSPDGNQLVFSTLSPNGSSDLRVLRRGGTESEYLLACEQSACGSAAWSPDETFLAFTRRSASTVSTTGGLSPPRIWLLSLESGETAQVFGDNQTLGFGPLWSGSGTWLSYLVPDQNGVGVYNLQNGETLFYETGTSDGGIWHPLQDVLLLSVIIPVDEQYRAYIYLADPATGQTNLEELTNLSGGDAAVDDSSPVWSPDGTQIAFRRKELEGEGASLGKQLWIMAADGTDPRALTANVEFDHGQPSWSPDGRFLLYHRFPLKGPDIILSTWLLDVETGDTTELISPAQRPLWLPSK